MHRYDDMESVSPTTRNQRHSPLFASPDVGPSRLVGLGKSAVDPRNSGWEEFGGPASLSSGGVGGSLWSPMKVDFS